MKMRRSIAGALCAASIAGLLMWGCASLTARPEFTKRDMPEVTRYLTTLISKSMKKNKIVGMSIALVDDQKLLWARGFGFADLENSVPATKNTVYRVGSISKVFTATAVMQLAQADKVDIDAPLGTYVPEFSIRTRFPDAPDITARNIMTHHSGLPTDYLRGMFAQSPESLEMLVSRIHDEYTAFPSEYVFCYSNLAMSILGRLVEHVDGREFSRYMHEEILHPLGMNRSSFDRRDETAGLLAKSYYKGKRQDEYPLRDKPAGSLYSSVEDMSLFVSMIFADGRAGETQLLHPSALQEMLRVQNNDTPLDLDTKTGLNWLIHEKEGMGTIVHHSGGVVSFYSYLYAVPHHKIAAIVMTNCVEGARASNEICMEALEALYELKTGTTVPKNKKPVPDVSFDPERLEEYTGYYDTIAGFVPLRLKGSRLVATIGEKPFVLVPRQDGTFGLKPLLFGFLPRNKPAFNTMNIVFKDVSGYRMLAHKEGETLTRVGTRLEAPVIPDAWQKRLGRYEVVEQGEYGISVEKITLRMEDGFLLGDVTGVPPWGTGISLALLPLDKGTAVVMGLGRSRGDTVTIRESGAGEVLYVYGYTFKRISFE